MQDIWIKPANSTVSGVKRELQSIDAQLADVSKQLSEMQSYAWQWTSSAPSDRYEKRAGTASKYFGPMDWDEIIGFVETSEQDWVLDPWNFYLMLDHLSDRFPAKMQSCNEAAQNLWLATSVLERMLEKGLSNREARKYLGMLEKVVLKYQRMVRGIQEEVTQLLEEAIDVTHQLRKIGVWRD